MSRSLLALLLSSVFLAACTPRIMAVRTTASVMESGAWTFDAESDPALAEEALASQLKMLEVFLANDPRNPRLLRLASKGFSGYAFLFLEGQDDARAKNFYARGKEYGLRLLKTRTACDWAAEKDMERLSRCLNKLRKGDAGALFWTTYGWGGWANLSRDSPDALADLPKIERLMARVEQLSPGYFYGGPDLFFGVYYGGRPKILGGEPESAKRHFEKALAAGGGKFLPALVFYARYYAVQVQDRALFERLLRQVAETPADVLPEQRLANEMARRRAQELLKKEEELFE